MINQAPIALRVLRSLARLVARADAWLLSYCDRLEAKHYNRVFPVGSVVTFVGCSCSRDHSGQWKIDRPYNYEAGDFRIRRDGDEDYDYAMPSVLRRVIP